MEPVQQQTLSAWKPASEDEGSGLSDTQRAFLAYRARENPATAERSGGLWSIPLLCLGMGMVALCIIIPQADANRRQLYERRKLAVDIAQIQKQITINDAFLKQIDTDPTIAQRLAERQMGVVRQGESAFPTRSEATGVDSPFSLVMLPPPAPLPEYEPIGGAMTGFFRERNHQPLLLGGGLILAAMGLVLDSSETNRSEEAGDTEAV